VATVPLPYYARRSILGDRTFKRDFLRRSQRTFLPSGLAGALQSLSGELSEEELRDFVDGLIREVEAAG